MWLSERTAAHTDSESTGAGGGALVGTVTIGGEKPAVLLCGEYRALGMAAPQGVAWRPPAGAQALVLETGDGERFLIGVVADGGGEPLGEGELRLSGKTARLRLGDELNSAGTARHTGDVYVTGRLFVNGKEVAVKKEEEETEAGEDA